jgi:STE24 endopeptidase
MQTFTLIFLFFLTVTSLIQIWLSFRQSRHVAQYRAAVPEEFAGKISLKEHQKAADYTRVKGSFGRMEVILNVVLVLLWTVGGGLALLDQFVRSFAWNELITGTVVILAMGFIASLIDLPASLYRTFVIEAQFGFNKLTLKTLIIDTVKTTGVSLIIGVPLIFLILWLMESAGDFWWLYAWATLTLFSLLMFWAYPKFIAPIFNKFTPLEEGEVKQRIEALLSRTGFNSQGVFVMDGSRRSSHGNAYFTGFGENKRIVFFDTLLEHLSAPQVEAVLAHELGHFKRKHIVKQMLLSTLMTLLGFAVLAALMQQAWFYSSLGVTQASTYMALILFMLVSPVFTFFIGPAMSWLSRKNEFEADEFAAQQSSAEELISALVGLYKENASTLTPDPVHSAFYDSHPPASIRIAHLKRQMET